MKIVIVLDRDLPHGLFANAAAVLAFSAARKIPDGVGEDVEDADGSIHPGITRLPIPILMCEREEMKGLRARASELENIGCIDFCDVAQRSKQYEEYTALMREKSGAELSYLGLCIYGEAASVKRLTGYYPLAK
jgi:hypothetical protein